eukprot:COSAG01_NODE_3690_length_5792_cov_45.557175_5_plen_43_part_00
MIIMAWSRYIHGCAEVLRDRHRGVVPRTLQGLQQLPGVGASA